jgi:molecular chaperone DnaK
MSQFNKTLGKFQLVDLPPAPRGVPQIEVTFDIDANGIVHVSAKDRATDNEQSMTITGQSALDKDVIDQMVRDAETHADEDHKRREQAEVRNNADNLLYQTRKMITDEGAELTDEEKSNVEEKLAALETSLEGDDIDMIKSAADNLMAASQEFGQRLYEAAQQDAATSSGEPGGGDDDVVDAEIVDEQ